ncbi:MAG: antibiotic biosynthesis monooxygenase [Thermoguttaceae bacterium]|nr:antibiotic biosynthesis monooxygenase [Thermoguttaceae bacterium]MDW8079573.1 putative quinol monooxygenase [Thermoguttaceae bacterium]
MPAARLGRQVRLPSPPDGNVLQHHSGKPVDENCPESRGLEAVPVIAVLACIKLRPDSREQFLEQFRRIVPLVRAEKGCIEYGPLEALPTSIPTQIGSDPHTIYVLEKWESLPDLERHLVAPHMIEYRRAVKPFVEEVGLYILKPLE